MQIFKPSNRACTMLGGFDQIEFGQYQRDPLVSLQSASLKESLKNHRDIRSNTMPATRMKKSCPINEYGDDIGALNFDKIVRACYVIGNLDIFFSRAIREQKSHAIRRRSSAHIQVIEKYFTPSSSFAVRCAAA